MSDFAPRRIRAVRASGWQLEVGHECEGITVAWRQVHSLDRESIHATRPFGIAMLYMGASVYVPRNPDCREPDCGPGAVCTVYPALS